MERYVGIDAHAASCTLAVVGASGKRLRSIVVDTNGRALVEAVKGIGGRLHVCLEEGTHSAWLYELLEPHAAEVVVTVPPETRGQKSDVRDAWSRAEELRTGAIRTRVYKAPVHFMALHTAVRAQLMATRDLTRAKNRLKAVWRSRGMMPDSAVYSAQKREAWLKRLPPPHALLAQWLARQIEALEPLRDDAEAWLDREAKTHPIIRKLSTTPGLGTVRTAQVVAIVADPHRFRTRQQFYKGRADWRAIASVAQTVSIPVTANGDVATVKDAQTCLARSSARAVMIGRAAVGRPWLVGTIGAALMGRHRPDPAPEQRAAAAVEHYEALLSLYGTETGLRHARKHLAAYADVAVESGFALDPAERRALVTSETPAEVLSILARLYARPERKAA